MGCDGFQIRNAGIHWFQSRKLRSVLCADAGYLMKRKTHFGHFHDLRIIRRADYRAEITVILLINVLFTEITKNSHQSWTSGHLPPRFIFGERYFFCRTLTSTSSLTCKTCKCKFCYHLFFSTKTCVCP